MRWRGSRMLMVAGCLGCFQVLAAAPADERPGPTPLSEPKVEVVPVEGAESNPHGAAKGEVAESPLAATRATNSILGRLQGWYVVADLRQVRSDVSAAELEAALQDSAGAVEVTRLDRSATGWSLGAGYRLSPRWAIESGVLDLGRFGSRIEARDADQDAVQRILARRHPVGGTGLRVVGVGRLQRGALSLSATLGLFKTFATDIEVAVEGETVTVKGKDLSALIAGAAGWQLREHWSAELFASYLELNQGALSSGLRFVYAF